MARHVKEKFLNSSSSWNVNMPRVKLRVWHGGVVLSIVALQQERCRFKSPQVCMLSLCLHGFPPASSMSPKKKKCLRLVGVSKLTLSMNVSLAASLASVLALSRVYPALKVKA